MMPVQHFNMDGLSMMQVVVWRKCSIIIDVYIILQI